MYPHECAFHRCKNPRKQGYTLCYSHFKENLWIKTGPGVMEGFHRYILVNGVFYPRTWTRENLAVMPPVITERANVAFKILISKGLPPEIIEMIFSLVPYHPS